MGKIADILRARGELDEALRIHKEERLPVYEKLQDAEGVAHTLWSIGRIHIQRKEIQEAAERIAGAYAILQQLGRLDGIVFVGIDLGQLLCGAGRKEEGMPILRRSHEGLVKLGLADQAKQLASLMDKIERGAAAVKAGEVSVKDDEQ